jgi:hypothetical protein
MSKKNLFLFNTEHVVYEGNEWALIADRDPEGTRVYGTHSRCTISYEENKESLLEGQHHYGEYCWLVQEPGSVPVCLVCGMGVPADFQAMTVLYIEGMKLKVQ